jgi:glycosyltransferase involved in cell wall biosynthesis
LRRLLVQQVSGPLRDRPSTLIVGLGDQGPLWGRARLCLVVNDVRRLSAPGTSGVAERLFYRVLTPRAARRAATVLTISAFSRDEVRRLLGVEAQVVAHHPRPAAAPVGDPDGHLLAVGALRPYKGLATAVEALALLPASVRRPLVVVGPEERRGEAERLRRLAARLGVGDLLRIEGWVAAEALAAARRGAALTVNPSLFEGYGLAVAESLAHGLPTVASDIPAHREVAGGAALLVSAGDAAALARAVEDALGRHEELAAAALSRARTLSAEEAGSTLAAAVLAAARA